MSNQHDIDANTAAWNIQVWASWLVAMGLMAGGILFMPALIWIKGYLLMGLMFTVGSTFSLAKTTRDNAESKRLRNRMSAAKTDKILREFELNDAA